MSDQPLFGRSDELERIDRFIAGLAQRSATRFVIGDAGVGKSVLLAAAAERATAAGYTVLTAVGSEFEVDVGYAGLNQLLQPVHDQINGLAADLREALTAALGLGAGEPPRPLVVANAALELARQIAETRPLSMLIDDIQWVDRSTSTVLSFIARRLDHESIGLVATWRRDTDGFLDRRVFDEIEIGPLDDAAALSMVDSLFPNLAPSVRQRVLRLAEGNPLAIRELPAAESSAHRASTRVEFVPLTQRLQTTFATQVMALPDATRGLLLTAAFEGGGDLRVLRAAGGGGHLALAPLAPAERAHLITVEEAQARFEFRHPLIQAAVVESSTYEERRLARQALAEALEHDPERQAWHLAEATVGPDEEVAAALERTAKSAMRRGDASAAMAGLIRAAELSPSADERARRLIDAAYVGAEASGSGAEAAILLADARSVNPTSPDSLRAATAAVFLLMNGEGDISSAHRLLVGAIEAGGHGYDAADPDLIEALHVLMLVCWYTGRADAWEPFERAVDALRPSAPDLLAMGRNTFADPARTAGAAAAVSERVLAALPSELDAGRIVRTGTASVYLDRLGDVREPSWRLVEQGRTEGSTRRHLGALMHLCLDDFLTGRWDESEVLSEEGRKLCERHGFPFFTWYFWYNTAIVAAGRGRFDEAFALADEITDWALPRGVLGATYFAHHPRALAAAGSGDFQAAFRHAAAMSKPGTLSRYVPHATWVVFDLVEAAIRTGRIDDAVAHAEALRNTDLVAVSGRMHLICLAVEALVAPEAAPSIDLVAALQAGLADRWTYDAARIQLAIGERRRRDRDPSTAAPMLEQALQAFNAMGAEPWSSRATNELRALGQRRVERSSARNAEMTEQELTIARLAAQGLTNKQIAERLYLSHRTVGAHLYRIFPKLGITTRAALRDALTRWETTSD